MGLFRSAGGGQKLLWELGKLAPDKPAREVRDYSDRCQALARHIRPATAFDLLAITNAMLREMDRGGSFEAGFEAVVAAYNDGTLVSVTGAPIRTLVPAEAASDVTALAARTFRSSMYLDAQRRAMQADESSPEQ